jgi:hypothetical protein
MAALLQTSAADVTACRTIAELVFLIVQAMPTPWVEHEAPVPHLARYVTGETEWYGPQCPKAAS